MTRVMRNAFRYANSSGEQQRVVGAFYTDGSPSLSVELDGRRVKSPAGGLDSLPAVSKLHAWVFEQAGATTFETEWPPRSLQPSRTPPCSV